jgi:hypothetical protein
MHEASRAKRRAAAAAAATAAIGSAGVSATFAEPAMAAHPNQTCPGNTLCEWADANFEGPVKWWGKYSRIDNYRLYNYDSNTSVPMDPNGPHGTAPSNVSSVWNNTDRWVTLCNNWYCNSTGAPDTEFGICLGPDKAISYLGVNGSGWNDVLSSHRTGTAPDHCAYYGSQEGCSL